MPNPLPPETTPEWTEQDERELQRNAALSDPWCLDQSMVFFIRRYAREILRLRSEREAQDAEIAKLGRQHFAALSKLDDENSRLRSELAATRERETPRLVGDPLRPKIDGPVVTPVHDAACPTVRHRDNE